MQTFQGRELHTGFSAEGQVRRSEFGIDFSILPPGGGQAALADVVTFELELQFVAPPVTEPT